MVENDQQLPELTRRQEEILSLIIEAYTRTPEPISSKYLVEQHQLSISSATVRNEMARLEEMGYIVAPHTSAGRIPTARGYRYFVRGLMNTSALSLNERNHINARFNELPTVLEQWMKQAATVLARTAHVASLITSPVSETNRFKHIELISIQGRLALMVLVLEGGMVHQRMLNLPEPYSQAALSESADHINRLCANLSGSQMRLKNRQLSAFEREIADIVAELMDRPQHAQVVTLYRDGLSEIINTFPDSEGAQQAVRVFEERNFLNAILTEVLQPLLKEKEYEGVRVVIAGDGRWEDLSHLSMVLSHYGIPGQLSGALGVLGPTNIDYNRAIGAVRHVSNLMTDMLVDMYQQEADDEAHVQLKEVNDGMVDDADSEMTTINNTVQTRRNNAGTPPSSEVS